MGISVFPAAGGGVTLQQQTFTSSGTFTLPSGYGAGRPLVVDIEICGGGGGGGGGASSTTSTTPGGGGGGGSGIVAVYKSVALTSNATVTIGAGGNGGAGANATASGADGTQGGTSDVNSLFFAPGGGYGSGGRPSNAGTSRSGGSIYTHGYVIPGGWQNTYFGAGGAGGSGGAPMNQASLSSSNTFGGCRGSIGGLRRSLTNSTNQSVNFTEYGTRAGRGLANQTSMNDSDPAGLQQVDWAGATTDILNLQRGGGGGGGFATNNNLEGGGGLAGSRFLGGQSGWADNTSVTGSKNGQSATDAGCGGGGGGARMADGGGTGGNGGNGAAGYCVITYWA